MADYDISPGTPLSAYVQVGTDIWDDVRTAGSADAFSTVSPYDVQTVNQFGVDRCDAVYLDFDTSGLTDDEQVYSISLDCNTANESYAGGTMGVTAFVTTGLWSTPFAVADWLTAAQLIAIQPDDQFDSLVVTEALSSWTFNGDAADVDPWINRSGNTLMTVIPTAFLSGTPLDDIAETSSWQLHVEVWEQWNRMAMVI